MGFSSQNPNGAGNMGFLWGNGLLPNGCITFPVTCRVSQLPRAAQRPFQLLMASWNCSQAALSPPCPVSKQSCCGGGCAVFYDRSDLRCWCLDSHPCPFKKKVVILIIFEYLIPLNWLRALHDHQWHLQKCFLRASSLTRL